jgi:1-acyl-sn-glycerol-3-phosphate acyltransferase
MNFFIMKTLLVLGATCTFHNEHELPSDRPLILVANHQSLYDIPAIFWYLRKHHIKFVAKKELGKGIPSISFNLRHGGSVMIDRKDQRQALPALKKFAEYIGEHNYAAVIFPEGTRSRDGQPKRFAPNGVKMLLKYAPNAVIVPITINNSWRLYEFGKYPMSVGWPISWKVHPVVDPKGRDFEAVLAEVEKTIKADIIDYQG